jgi:hypothetical protein
MNYHRKPKISVILPTFSVPGIEKSHFFDAFAQK